DGIVAKLITALKYAKCLFYVPPLGELLVETFSKWLSKESINLIVPVPLHIEKLKERGFNQALLLAKELAKRTGIPCSYSVLIKTRKTPPQVALRVTERKKNLRQAFAISPAAKAQIRDASVLVIDDVITTGTTINECAKSLKAVGASRVIGLSVARTPF
ncbi:MAG: ComF family protein, partial [Thermodesulforhabdaceae bacterium]